MLRIVHQKQSAAVHLCLPPSLRSLFRGNQKNDCGLDAVGVLKLVDKDMFVSLTKRNAHGLVIRDEVVGAQQKVVEIERGGLALAPRIRIDDISKRVGQSSD